MQQNFFANTFLSSLLSSFRYDILKEKMTHKKRGVNMAKTWTFYKNGCKMHLSIDMLNFNVKATLKLNDSQQVDIKDVIDKNGSNGLLFRSPEFIDFGDGEKRKIIGIILADFDRPFSQSDEIKEYFSKLQNQAKEHKKEIHDAEYDAIMSGQKPLDIKFHDGDNWSGMEAFGVSADVVLDLHCGRYLDGIGYIVDPEFADGDIGKMKLHFQEYTAKQKEKENLKKELETKFEKEKAEALAGIDWHTTERFSSADGKFYVHELSVNGKTYIFQERNVDSVGLVINPCYSVQEGVEPGGAVCCESGKYYWEDFKAGEGWYIVRELQPDELRAYKIVSKYGKLTK